MGIVVERAAAVADVASARVRRVGHVIAPGWV